MKSLFIKNIPPELGRRLKVASIKTGVTMQEMVLVAIGEYLDRGEFKPIEPGGIIEVDSLDVCELKPIGLPSERNMSNEDNAELTDDGEDVMPKAKGGFKRTW